MSTVKGANVTKYDAGGTGDNIIAEGYIKSVEKVWIDSYTYASAATIGAGLQIQLAVLPQGKVVTGIDLNVTGLTATTTHTVSLGTILENSVSNTTIFMAATRCGGTVGSDTVTGSQGVKWLKANGTLPYALTGGVNRIIAVFSASATVTVGTIRSIVRYV